MRHRKASLKLNRTSSHRNAMFRNMVTSLFKYERIRTTDAKAKELRRWADNMITLAKRGDLHARRQALSIIREKGVVHKLFEDATERYGSVNGGYARVVKLARRPGDAAPISMIELIIPDKRQKKKVTKKKVDVIADRDKAMPEKAASEEKEEIPDEEKIAQKTAEASEDMKDIDRDPAEVETEKVEPDTNTDETNKIESDESEAENPVNAPEDKEPEG